MKSDLSWQQENIRYVSNKGQRHRGRSGLFSLAMVGVCLIVTGLYLVLAQDVPIVVAQQAATNAPTPTPSDSSATTAAESSDPTATPTDTPPATDTPTTTPTETLPATDTPTITPTAADTPLATPTEPASPTVTSADPATSTAPPTETAGPTATSVVTQTPTITPTTSLPETNTPIATSTTLFTTTATPAATLTTTATSTASPTMTATPTTIPTVTATSTTTPTLTATPTITPTIIITPTATVIPTPVPTPLPSNTPDEILVKLSPLLNDFSESVDGMAKSLGAEVKGMVRHLDVWVWQVPPGRASQIIITLQDNPFVELVEPNYAAQAFLTPDDPNWTGQSYLSNIQLPQAWEITTGSSDVVIAVVDTGVDTTHPDLTTNIWHNPGEIGLDSFGADKRANGLDDDGNGYVDDWQGWNTVSKSGDVDDDHGHGTHMAGVSAAATNNGQGIAGVAWNAQIMPIKVLDSTGFGTYAQIVEGIVYAVDQGAQVINLSLGSSTPSVLFESAIEYAATHNVTVVAATGNSGADQINYPAAYASVIGVGATDAGNQLTSFSTTGVTVDLVAPGVDIHSTYPNNNYNRSSGTSLAAAHVSGVAALMASLSQFDRPYKIRTALLATALDLGEPGRDMAYGSGLVQAYAALNYDPTGAATPTPTAVPTPGPTPTPSGGGAGVYATEVLWGIAQTCAYVINNAGNSIDGPTNGFDALWADCTGQYGNGGDWTYTDVENTAFASITAASLNIQFYAAGQTDDVVELQSNNGAGWVTLEIFNAANPLPTVSTLRTYDVSANFTTPAEINAAQIRFLGTSRNGGPPASADNITLYLDEANLTVTGSSNTAPVANNDTYSTTQDTILNMTAPGVLGNDTDADGDSLTVVLPPATNVSNGTLALNADGSFDYTPNLGFTGTDSFTYYVNDGTENSASPATVTITVGTMANPHGGYSAATDTCALCHRAHTAASPSLIVSGSTGNAFCLTCHDGSSATEVSTHSNLDKAGVEENFEVQCVQCHEPHGSTNLFSVRSDVRVTTSPLVTIGPVVFTAVTGTNSYDDGTSSLTSRLCVACHSHASNPNAPLQNHDGGANHSGGSNYEGQDCTTCHPHDPDSDYTTKDGFMPSGGGSCRGCHNVPKGSRRQIVAAGGDFVRTSHHVTGADAVTDADCEVCHEQTLHQAGTVRLFNVDNPATVYPLDGIGDAAEVESFCLACHDANGAGGSAPFSDATMPPVIDSAAWGLASHNTAAAVGSCIDCHDNGHGSNKNKLLAPWNYSDDGDPDDGMMQEERFCYNCHSSSGYPQSNTASNDVATTFAPATNWADAVVGTNSLVNLNDRHDVAATDQSRSGSVIECVNCHDPHVATMANPLIADPDPSDGRTPGSGYFPGADFMSDWCSDCHDLSYPAGVVDGHVDDKGNLDRLIDVLSLHDGANNGDDAHGARNGNVGSITEDGPPDTDGWVTNIAVQCMDCHVRHVSGPTPVTGGTNLFHLKTPIMTRDGSTPLNSNANTGANGGTPDGNYELTIVSSFVSDNQNGYSWCNTCHDGSQMKSGEANCTGCHMHGSRW